jgi:hypothetical protein
MPYYVDRTGEVWEYADAAQAEQSGLRPATRADLERHNAAVQQRETRVSEISEDERWDALSFGDKASEVVQGVGLGAVKGLHGLAGATGNENVGGIGDLSRELDALGAEEFRQRHPTSSGIGKTLPALPLALAAGAGAAGFVGGLAAGAGAGAAASTVAGVVAEELVGGATVSTADEYGDAYLQKRPVELGRIAEGTLWNAGGGLALRGVGAGLRGAGGLLGRAQESLVSRAARKSAARRTAGKFATHEEADAFDAVYREAIDGMTPDDVQGLVNHGPSVLEAASYRAGNALRNLFRAAGDELGVGVKYENWARFSEEWTPEMARRQATFAKNVRNKAASAIKNVQELFSEGFEIKGAGPALRRMLEGYELRLRKAVDPLRRAEILDDFKRTLDTFDASVANSKLDTHSKEALLKEVVNPLANFVREGLEDTKSFGRAALEQQAENKVWVPLIQNLMRLQGRYIGRDAVQEYGKLGFARSANTIENAKVKDLLGGPIFENFDHREAMRQLVKAYDDMAKVRAEFGLDPSVFQPLREDAFAVFKEMRRGQLLQVALKKATDLKINPSRGKAAVDALSQNVLMGSWGLGVVRPLGIARGIAQAMSGKGTRPLGTGPVATLIGEGMPAYAKLPQVATDPAVAGAWTRGFTNVLREYGAPLAKPPPGAVGRAKAGLVRMADSPVGHTLGRLGQVADDRALKVAARLAPSSGMMQSDQQEPPDTYGQEYSAVVGDQLRTIADDSQRQLDNVAARLLTGGANRSGPNLSRFSRGGLPAATRNVRELLDSLSNDAGAVLDRIVEGMGDVSLTHPGLQQSMLQKTLQTVDYLKQQVPPAIGRSPFNPKGHDPTFEQSYEFALRYLGAVEPGATLNDIAAGVAAPQQVDAFRTNWPSVYTQLVETVMAQLQGMSQSGKRVSQERMRQLDMLLNLDGAGEAALSWAVADSIELGRNQLQQQTQQPPRTTTTGASLASNFATRRGARRELRRSM